MAFVSVPRNPLPHQTVDYADGSVTGPKLAPNAAAWVLVDSGSESGVLANVYTPTGVLPTAPVYFYSAKLSNITGSNGGVFTIFNNIELLNYEWSSRIGTVWTYTTGVRGWQHGSALANQTVQINMYISGQIDDSRPHFSELIPGATGNTPLTALQDGVYNVFADYTITTISTQCQQNYDIDWNVFALDNQDT